MAKELALDGVWGQGPTTRTEAGVRKAVLFTIYIHSSNNLGKNNPNKLSKDVLDLIPASEAAR